MFAANTLMSACTGTEEFNSTSTHFSVIDILTGTFLSNVEVNDIKAPCCIHIVETNALGSTELKDNIVQ
jgi:hypothetical protein